MDPIRTVNSNFTYLGPAKEVADLPCQREADGTASVWKLTDEERTMIANGAQIRLKCYGAGHVPVSLSIVNEVERPNPDDLRCERCSGILVVDIGGTELYLHLPDVVLGRLISELTAAQLQTFSEEWLRTWERAGG